MLNYWWVTRPKRRLNSVPEVLSTFVEQSLNSQWQGERGKHLQLEDALEAAGLKRKGERRDQTGGGARTYKAWIMSLGLLFIQETTGRMMLTLAGEAIMNGDSPVAVLKEQVLKYQFPSAYSLSRGVEVSERFKIRPFRFLLRLLMDERVSFLTEEEIAKIIIVEAEDETDNCYERIVSRIHDFRSRGDKCLDPDFFTKYSPSKGTVNQDHPFSYLTDIANTLINWLDYTQLIERSSKEMRVLTEKRDEVTAILSVTPPFIDRPNEHEFFQRKYGLDPKHRKDTRNLANTPTVTLKVIAEQKIKQAYITESLRRPIAKITPAIIDKIIDVTGLNEKLVEETLYKLYPAGSIGGFMTKYYEMAFKGRDEATDFEKATAELFQEVFEYKSLHVGPIGLTPDVLILSDVEGYQAIIDNKAYSRYTISNDHHNRMVHNYIENLDRYSKSSYNLGFFSYIAGGFGTNFDAQVRAISAATGVPGSGMSVSNMIKLVECYNSKGYTHKTLRELFSVNRQILMSDFA